MEKRAPMGYQKSLEGKEVFPCNEQTRPTAMWTEPIH